MAKISALTDGGDPQAADQFVVARGGLNFKLIWSTIEAYLDTLFALVATGVTNGNSHDHSGGDGAQINHTTLSNIGTNTHAQIDAHIAAAVTPEWTTINKTADESISSDDTLNNDSDLVAPLLAGKTYAIRGRVWFTTSAVADFKFQFLFAGTTIYVKYTSYPAGSTTGTVGIETSSPTTSTPVTGAGTVGGYIEFDAAVTVDGSDRNFFFRWAQNTSAAAATKVKAGSYIEYALADP